NAQTVADLGKVVFQAKTSVHRDSTVLAKQIINGCLFPYYSSYFIDIDSDIFSFFFNQEMLHLYALNCTCIMGVSEVICTTCLVLWDTVLIWLFFTLYYFYLLARHCY
uniref:Uncharacterized protein n=1 Tax=Scleropages formosus TaxID=113540 RepID=A0A8D0CJW5_SCLFO